ncbi:MAG: hypothetical protein V4622_04480 [Bacteroidota bacterium]
MKSIKKQLQIKKINLLSDKLREIAQIYFKLIYVEIELSMNKNYCQLTTNELIRLEGLMKFYDDKRKNLRNNMLNSKQIDKKTIYN